MSRVSAGTEDQIKGTSGKLEVVADRLADDILEAQEWRPEALRVVFKIHGSPKEEVSWAIPIESPNLFPYTSNVPQGEAALRKTINGMLDTRPRWANVYNGFINQWLAPPGTHIGKLDNIRGGVSADTGKVWSFIRLKTREGFTASFPAGWPEKLEKKVGDTPREDWIGPEPEFNSGKSPFLYLCQLGLDWERWTKVDLEEAPALFNGHYDSDGRQVAPYFENIEDWSLELMAACKLHGLKSVQFKTDVHPKHGLGIVKPQGKYFFALTPVIIEGSPEDKAYQDERVVFYEMWDNLTKVVKGDKARFATVAGKPTPEGAEIVRGLIVPAVRLQPEIVKYFVDGEPKARFPVEHEDWRTNGLVVLDLMAERLMKTDVAALCGDVDAFTAWLAENVPELADDLTVDEAEEF